MPTTKQDQDFADEMQSCVDAIVISKGALDSAINYISRNLSPDEVFSEKELLEFAGNYDPEAVFKEGSLGSWAESNGYTKE